MKVLKFTLGGRTAFFKKPDVNSYYYFTYGNIHRVAILGILGAILGYKGYNQQTEEKTVYPEFYQKLKDVKLGIVPRNDKGYIAKKVQVFNNSVGYASKEQGGNLIVKEQWLENPKWDIYLLVEDAIGKELCQRMVEKRFKYIPYLGKNDHGADITDVEVINPQELISSDRVDSLIMKDCFNYQVVELDPFDIEANNESIFKYQEMLPIALEETTNKYELESFVLTNAPLELKKGSLIYQCNNKIIFFF
ncbi:type I-B CRISPR-associated protein Cas5b [Alkaliphilus hydrothermalis]|uniref:CRISPR-associated protein Cas5h n=1 Tax=Alkaliphilus hydrothermalis TaxID=1482730 RepID=A0ABS2NNH7_9FIRM|nr:type I-B CRISPR-associated protein Cas5b [Alkaliphilus hydrothermalis]MBM7614504.1 CRISPR-associated protein Cas5h [Alkaliphilus hydrothermalis]